jgi:hypothetical protein
MVCIYFLESCMQIEKIAILFFLNLCYTQKKFRDGTLSTSFYFIFKTILLLCSIYCYMHISLLVDVKKRKKGHFMTKKTNLYDDVGIKFF